MHTPIPFPRAAVPGATKLDSERLVVVYEDFTTALWALENLSEATATRGRRAERMVSAWSFSSLANRETRERATECVTHANRLVLAANANPQPLPEVVCDWLTHCLADRQATPCAVLAALSDPTDRRSHTSSHRLQTLRALVKESGGELLTPSIADEKIWAVA